MYFYVAILIAVSSQVEGSVTCYGENVKNATCPKDQYMVVKIASFRGLLPPKLCGSSDDYSCNIDVTCLLKKQCDGLHECNITVDDNLISGDPCPGLSNYLHFEFQCADNAKPYQGLCIHDVSLSNESLPYQGVVQIALDSGIKNVCWQHLSNNVPSVICTQLGFPDWYQFVQKKTNAAHATHAIFSGSIYCTGREEHISQCSINMTRSGRCSEITYIQCFSWLTKPLLQDKRRIPDSSFSASASSEGHGASNARISSGSSWCAPLSADGHYLQVDFGRYYIIDILLTYGDSNSSRWVTTYDLNVTDDLVHWRISSNYYTNRENRGGYHDAASRTIYDNGKTRAVRIIPLAYVGQACMRVEIFGQVAYPDKPGNLMVTNIASRSVVISWLDPENPGHYGFSNFLINLKKDNVPMLNITTGRVNEYMLHNLTPNTAYEISLAAGSRFGNLFGEEATVMFQTLHEDGSVTCYGEKVKNANCPNNQYIVVNIASFRGLLQPKLCGSSYDYSCNIDVTCRVKKQCDGLQECNITVDDNFISGDLCPGLSNYLYFEYQCSDNVEHYQGPCIQDVSLSNNSLPYKGIVQISLDAGIKNVCWQSLNNNAYNVICRQLLGYPEGMSVKNISNPVDGKDAIFSGIITCDGREEYISQCSINMQENGSCSELTYIQCFEWFVPEALLQDKQRFPDLSFSASASSEGHGASNARITSGSSWCAPLSADRHYLQVDFGRYYIIDILLTYGDSNSSRWVTAYNLNVTDDLVHWKANSNSYLPFGENHNGYDDGSVNLVYIGKTKAVRIIPLTYVGQACMRVQFWGEVAYPDKPGNLMVTNIASRSVAISWLDPENPGHYGFSNFLIKLKKDNVPILNITTGRVNEYILHNLTLDTAYEISLAAGTRIGNLFW